MHVDLDLVSKLLIQARVSVGGCVAAKAHEQGVVRLPGAARYPSGWQDLCLRRESRRMYQSPLPSARFQWSSTPM